MAADDIVQDTEWQATYGQQHIDYGNAYIAHHTQQAQNFSNAVDTLGDVHDEYKKTWHTVTKPAYLAAHTSHGQAHIDLGTTSKLTGVVFDNADQENASRLSQVMDGVTPPNGTLT